MNCRMLSQALVLAMGLALPATGHDADTLAAEPMFPGGIGFGIRSPAGRGGHMLHVTNLDARGEGSLRAALAAKGPRLVVFDVGGIIDLDGSSLRIAEPFLTVAGQTAPSPGITVIRGGMVVLTHDVLIQHLRVRPGDAGRAKRSGWEPDGLTTSGADAYNVVVDHCSFTWAVDENLSVSGPRHDGPLGTSRKVTLSHCIIAEGLDNASHAKGRHSKGTLVHDHCTDVAVIGNLYAHNVDRNPYFKAGTTGVVVNNLIYNPGRRAIKLNYVEAEYAGQPVGPVNGRVAVVGNVLRYGRDTRRGTALVDGRGDVYLRDNLAWDREGKTVPTAQGKLEKLDEPPCWPEGLQALPAAEVSDFVLRHAGARPDDRDAVDRRIVEQVRSGGGRIIDSQDDVGGYPSVEAVRRPALPPAGDLEAWLWPPTAP